MGEKKVAIKIMSKVNKNDTKHPTYNEEKVDINGSRYGWRLASYRD